MDTKYDLENKRGRLALRKVETKELQEEGQMNHMWSPYKRWKGKQESTSHPKGQGKTRRYRDPHPFPHTHTQGRREWVLEELWRVGTIETGGLWV